MTKYCWEHATIDATHLLILQSVQASSWMSQESSSPQVAAIYLLVAICHFWAFGTCFWLGYTNSKDDADKKGKRRVSQSTRLFSFTMHGAVTLYCPVTNSWRI